MKKTIKSIISLTLAIVCLTTSISPIQTNASSDEDNVIDFSMETDDALFSTTYGDWSVSDGVYKANTAWANAYLTEAISLDEDKEISFDFCLQDDNATDHQFNVALANVIGSTISGGVTSHFYYSSQWSIEMGTLNSDFGSATGGTWYADTTTDYFDGQTHTMTISITDKIASYKIDENVVFTNVEIGLESVYFIFQATSTEYTIDNIKITSIGTEEQVIPEYGEMEIDFDVEEDASIFSSTYGGWSVIDGTYKANTAWANTYTNFLIPLDAAKEISFDFCLQNDNVAEHQFNVGLVNISETTISGGVSTHFYYSATHQIEMGTLNSEFGSTTGGTWYADTTTNYFDGQTHTMTISIAYKTASYKIDGNDVFTSAEIGLDSAYLIFQSTSVDYTIDNLKMVDIKEEVKYNGSTIDFEETSDANIFGTTYGSWSVDNGTYQADSAWSNSYLNYLIPLNADNQISFDFCLQNDNASDHQFNAGLVNVSDGTISGGVTAHFYYSAAYQIEMGTLNSDFGSATGGTWYADTTTNYFDGQEHTMTIIVANKILTYEIDGTTVFATTEIDLDSAYLVFQSTSTEYTVDNINVKDVAAKVAGYSLTLDGSIGLKFYLSMSSVALDKSYDNVNVQFTMDDATQTVTYAEAQEIEAGYAAFTCDVPAKEMTEQIVAEIYNGDTKLGTVKYSVRDYATALCENVIAYEKEISLIQAMLNYGSYAQIYFGYRSDDLANNSTHLGNTSLDDVDITQFEAYQQTESYNDENISLYGTSLIMESKTTLRLYFTGAQIATATCNGEPLIQKGNYYYVDITNIIPQNLADDYTVTLEYSDGQSIDVTYNCMTYCYKVLQSEKMNLKALVKALYLYSQAAMDYEAPNDSMVANVSVPYQECSASYTVYVSTEGDDSNDGNTLETAVASLEQAQTLVQTYLDEGGTGDCQILIDDGEYFLSAPLNLTQQDTANGNSLYIRAINANEAILTGSKQVEPDSITEVYDEALGRVWKIPCTNKINQLYIDNNYAIRARFPDAGEELRLLTWDTTLQNIIIDSQDIVGFDVSDFAGSTLVANIMWAESYLRILNVEDNGTTSAVNFVAADLGVFSRSTPQIKERQSYHFENAKAFLNTSGEWYYAADEGVVYYLPYEYERLNNTIVRIPYTEELLTVKGTAESPVTGVFVEGLNFKWTNNGYVDGKLGNQANKDDGSNKRFSGTSNDGRPISAISLEYAAEITFSGNVFSCMGGGAIDLIEGVQDTVIEKNVFKAIGGNGVFAGAINYYVDQVSTEETSFIKNIKIENNYFNDVAWQEYSGCPIILNYAVDSKISYNTISNAKYTGISVGWGWQKTELPFLKNNEISYNKVTNVVSLMSDGAAIYMVGCQPNSVIKNNYIDNVYNSVYKFPNDLYDEDLVKWSTAGIYLDQGVGGTSETDKVQVTDNLIVESHVDIQKYITHNAQEGYFELIEPDASEEDSIIEGAGVQEDGFTLFSNVAVLYGSHTESENRVSVYGKNLGTSNENMLVIKGTEGTLTQVSEADIVTWTDEMITLTTSNYASGILYVLNTNGISSNKIFVTCNVDEEYCMYSRFEDEWGGLEGLAALQVVTQEISSDGFSCSTYLDDYPANAIADGSKSTGWSSGADDTNPYVQFSLEEAATIDKIVIYSRAGVDQEECRRNFNVYGIDEEGNTCLIYAADVSSPVFDADGMLVIDVDETEYKDTTFEAFKIGRPEGDSTYFFVAEVAII